MQFWKQRSLAVIATLWLGLWLSLSACGSTPPAREDGKLYVVATTTMLADLVQTIGGEHVVCVGLMGAGIDPHLYQASAGDVAELDSADLVAYHGFHLEGKMGEVFAQLTQQGKEILCLEEGIDPRLLLAHPDYPEMYDPHIWFDAALWGLAAEYVAAVLSAVDPDHQEAYWENYSQYAQALDVLDSYAQARVAELAPPQRVLITAHDAFGYFGAAYGFEVLGLQGITTETEAGTADVRQLATLLVSRRIPAIFVESSVPAKSIEALQDAVEAQGFSVAIGGQLYSDALGDASTGHQTYLAAFRANVDTIVDALAAD